MTSRTDTRNATMREDGSRLIAIVSGKGGSGKTMLATAMGSLLSAAGRTTILVDADVATGGLSYYLGLHHVESITTGFTDLLFPRDSNSSSVTSEMLQVVKVSSSLRLRGGEDLLFLPVGRHRRVFQQDGWDLVDEKIPAALTALSRFAEKNEAWVIIDCRGGIDDDSSLICSLSDDIIMIAETDAASFQATGHLVEVLSDAGAGPKIRGFILNKVFDDPSPVASIATSAFKSSFLGAVPFDVEATRSFLLGEIPTLRSSFVAHVSAALRKHYQAAIPPPVIRTKSPRDFRGLILSDQDSARGGLLAAALVLATAVTLVFTYPVANPLLDLPREMQGALFVILVAGLGGCLEPTRRWLGRAVASYFRLVSRLSGAWRLK